MMDANMDTLDLKLSLIRAELNSGFLAAQSALNAQSLAMEKDSKRVSELEIRLRAIEVEAAKSELKFKIIGILIGLPAGGVGAILSRFLWGTF